MGLWEVTEEVLGQAERSREAVPCYSHISHRALKDIPKEYTNPYNCKVRALAFNNNHKVTSVLRGLGSPASECLDITTLLASQIPTSNSNLFLKLVAMLELH